jgi:nucleoside-diphosphate-sugar epimerase
MSSSKPSEFMQPDHCAKGCTGTTDVLAMQRMFKRYTASLPQGTENRIPPSHTTAIAILGSTGFLGPHIVASLLQAHPRSEIVCVNRSVEGKQRTMSALRNIIGDISTALPRLHFLVTDITNPSVGLDSVLESSILVQLNEVVFNAWDPNWSKPLEYFEPFLRALRSIVNFCAAAAGRPRITFISSICAVGNWPLLHPDQLMVPEEVVWDCGSAMPHGYGESKCVGEQLLAEAHRVAGLPVNIVRAGQIGGPMNATLCTWPRQGWLYSIIKSSEKLGAFPKDVQALDWIPVDSLAQGIANCIKNSPMPGALRVFNMIHPDPAPWGLFHETLRNRFGISASAVSLPDWLGRMEPGELRLHSFLSTQGHGREANMTFENDQALTVLPPVATIDADLLARWLRGWKIGRSDWRAKM